MLTARQRLEVLTERPLTPSEYKDPFSALFEHLTECSMVVDYLRGEVMALTDWTGDVLSLTKDGFPVPTSEDARAVVKLYGEWSDRKRKAAAECIKAGISERMVRIAEDQWRLMASVVRDALAESGLSSELRATVERSIGQRLRLLATSN